MKHALLILLVPCALCAAADTRPIDQPEAKREVTFASEGEDATSTFHYFFYKLRGDDTLAKVRMLSDGGAQNKPSISDFYLDGSAVHVVERSAERADLPALRNGRDAAFETVKEQTIELIGDDSRPGEPSKLDREQHRLLGDLISMLSMTRKPLPKNSR